MIPNCHSFVSKDVLIDIDDARQEFSTFEISDCISRIIEYESNSHSDMIEHPHTEKGKRKLSGNSHSATSKTMTRLTDAWKYALANFNGSLDRELVEKVGSIIVEDELRQPFGYRNENVRISGLDTITPPRYEKVPYQMDHLFDVVNNWGLHPVDKALITHLHLARIHPFVDGNGRTARLLQNLLLHHEGFAPATVRISERTFYQNQLRDAMKGYTERIASGKDITTEQQLMTHGITEVEKKFFDYMASKILISYEEGIQKAEAVPQFEITLTTPPRNRGAIYSLEHMFKGYLRKTHQPFKVKVEDTNAGKYRIIGNITPEVIAGIFIKAQKFYDGSYDLTNLNKKLR